MKRTLLFVFLCLFLTFGSSAATVIAPIPEVAALRIVQQLATGEPVRIVGFGDSVTGVYYHTGNRRAWCDLVGLALQRLYPQAHVEMINAGISGNTTADGLARMDADVLRHRPQLVIAMFGLNDVARGTPEDFRANLRTVVHRSRDAGAEVMLMTPNFVSDGDDKRPIAKVADYARITREVGREMSVPVADTFEAFRAIQARDHHAWLEIMSDHIHPNLRGHRVLAEEAVRTLTGQRVSLAELPPLEPRLPRVLARLQAHETIRVTAMKPYDSLIAPALLKIFPDARVEVTPWDAAGKSVAEIEAQAKGRGWPNYRDHPQLTRPDLVVLAVPADARAASEDEFFHSYTWIMNWSLSFNAPHWDCLVILPSVAQPTSEPAQQGPEKLALDVVLGQDLPWLQRMPGDQTAAAELLRRQLAELLGTRKQ